jgi:hypothetical protein
VVSGQALLSLPTANLFSPSAPNLKTSPPVNGGDVFKQDE